MDVRKYGIYFESWPGYTFYLLLWYKKLPHHLQKFAINGNDGGMSIIKGRIQIGCNNLVVKNYFHCMYSRHIDLCKF
jgi:hypothetical protein